MPTDPHQPLRDDVRLLGELLGETIRAQAGEHVFRTVERVRTLAKSARAGNHDDFRVLSEELSGLSLDEATLVARAFAHFLHLANIAEQHHRVRRRRAYQHDPAATPQRGSCEEEFPRLLNGGLPPERLYDAVCALRIELVLTAHPTQVARRRIMQKHNRIAAALATRDRPDLTMLEREEVLNALRREIEGAWATSEVRAERLTPIDEVRSGLVVFEQSLWDAVPQFLRGLDSALRVHTGRALPLDAAPVRFGSWIGGDRDGNPSVTPEVTRRACLLSRWVAADGYVRDIDRLRDELSMESGSPELHARVDAAVDGPYRELLRIVRARMTATRVWIEKSLASDEDVVAADDVYVEPDDLMADLMLCHRSLEQTGLAHIASGELTDIIRRVAIFGVTLARLDVRQDSARHGEALAEITSALGLGSYTEWDEEARVRFLVRELASRSLDSARDKPLIPPDLEPTPDTRDVLETFAMIARAPVGSLGAYVITMTRSVSDVLAVELLQK
jgi:phosphoenolpyruvate carboxylase